MLAHYSGEGEIATEIEIDKASCSEDPQLQLWMSTLDLETQDLVSLPGPKKSLAAGGG